MTSEYWKEVSNARERRLKHKWKDWKAYKHHILTIHPRSWYGLFIDSDVCYSCGKSIIGWFNLHVHHITYNPKKTSLIHALCHNKEFSKQEAMNRGYTKIEAKNKSNSQLDDYIR